MPKVTSSQKIRLVLNGSNMVPMPVLSPLLQDVEGYQQGEEYAEDGKLLHEREAEERPRPRLLECLRLTVDARDNLPEEVSHTYARTDHGGARRDAYPHHGDITGQLK